MQSRSEEARPPSLDPRVALLSIVGFWFFYFTIVTIRSVALYTHDQLGRVDKVDSQAG